MFIYINVSNNPGAWWVGPLTLFLSLAAQSGWRVSWQAVQMLLMGASTVALVLLGYRMFHGVFPHGVQSAWQRAQQWWQLQQQGAEEHAQRRARVQQQQQRGRPRRPSFGTVARALQRLPTEPIATAAELQQLPALELKERLQRLGLDPSNCVEKHDLVAQLLQAGGSSSTTCSICCEEYEPGDAVRVLPCPGGGHRYHIECIDKWFLSSTDRTKEPACPMCNHPLPL